jgi:hypothetical protein
LNKETTKDSFKTAGKTLTDHDKLKTNIKRTLTTLANRFKIAGVIPSGLVSRNIKKIINMFVIFQVFEDYYPRIKNTNKANASLPAKFFKFIKFLLIQMT